MKTTIKLLSLSICIFFLLNSNKTNAQCNTDDWNALKALYESTNGDNWTNRTGWDVMIDNLNSPPANCNLSTLFGISTENGRVTCIDLDGEDTCSWTETGGNNLNGTIPPELSNLTNLSEIRLSNNQLNGNFPVELQNLNDLFRLELQNNQLSGSIPPEIGNFTSLLYVRLSYNDFDGNLPSEIGNLIDLNQLYLDNNRFDGSIPSSIGNLTDLTDLTLDDNPLTGSIPSSIGNLNNLLRLSVSNTNINNIPSQIGNLSSLGALYMGNINLPQSNIPSQIWNLTNLGTLSLLNNNFIGSIPPEIGNLTNLESFDVRNNNLTGTIPSSFGNLTKLKGITFSGNNFQGNILDIITNFQDLENFQASGNQFTGNIPSSIGNLTQLKEISLYDNNFSGMLPPELCDLNQLALISLGQNQFEGCYPNCLSNYCDLDFWTNENFWISEGNNYDADWEDFCSTCAGACDNTPCQENNDTSVYPGDLNHDGIVNHQDVGLSGLFLYEVGPPRTDEHRNITWYAHPAEDWNRQQINNEDYKHFDCNGDGEITQDDHQAVEDNMGRTWTNPLPSPPPPDFSDYKVMLLPSEQVLDSLIVLKISLERRSGGNLTMQGGHFTIDYSEITGNINFVTPAFNNTSWLGNRAENLFYEVKEIPMEKKIEVGFTKTNNANSSGSGIIGQLIVSFISNQTDVSKTSNNLYEFSVKNVGTHNGINYTPIENQILQVDVIGGNCQSNLIITEDSPFQNTYKSSSIIQTNGFVLIGASQKIEYKATNRITLNSGFRVKEGADFKVKATACQ